ncbi:Lysylphosphatidylglycerol synthase TM region [uncultured archaeon]|nr:Lysylphosphatidylglycerol synthase TM region [uncultured archaeon]
MERFKARNIFFVVVIGAIIFVSFTKEIGFEKFLLLIENANKLFFLLVILFNFLNILVFTITWKYLIPANISLYKLFTFFMAGGFINNITPTFGTGGEPVKAMLLGKETGTSKAECFAGVVSQRMLNMFPFLVIGGLGVALLFSKPEIKLGTAELLAIAFSIGLAFSLFGLIIYFYIRKDKLSSFVNSSIRFLAPFIGLVKKGFDQQAYADAVQESINSFHGGLKNIHDNKHGLVKATLFSFLGWIFDILAIYAVFLSLGETHIHISVLIITYTISMMSGWLPLFLPGGLGIVDGTMAALFIFSGVPAEIAIVATWLYRLVNYWLNTLLGGFYLWLSLKPK